MDPLPLEDTFTDILGKAQRGLTLDDAALAARAGLAPADIARVRDGAVEERVLRALAPALGLGAAALVASARKAWRPAPLSLDGLAQFNTPFLDMTVNSYLVWDLASHAAAAFDTGAGCGPMLDFAREQGLAIRLILLTHTHGDHVADLERLRGATGAPVHVGEREPVTGAQTFAPGRRFELGALGIDTRLTWGHSAGGITYVVSGLARPVAVVGDAVFAGSMGGGGVSYSDALATNRQQILSLPAATILCPGHGPMTTVGEELGHNPFFTGAPP